MNVANREAVSGSRVSMPANKTSLSVACHLNSPCRYGPQADCRTASNNGSRPDEICAVCFKGSISIHFDLARKTDASRQRIKRHFAKKEPSSSVLVVLQKPSPSFHAQWQGWTAALSFPRLISRVSKKPDNRSNPPPRIMPRAGTSANTRSPRLAATTGETIISTRA